MERSMTRKRFLTILFLITISLIFLKIYQHNLLIRLNYEKQRIENKKNELKRKKNELLVEYFKLKNQHRVKKLAQENLGLKPIKLSQITRFNQKEQ